MNAITVANRTPLVSRSQIRTFTQSVTSYWMGILFGLVALAGVIGSGLVAVTMAIGPQRLIVLFALSATAAVMCVVFLVQSWHSHKRYEMILERLREQRNIEEGRDVASEICDNEMRNRTYASIALQLCKVEHPERTIYSTVKRPVARLPKRRFGKFIVRKL